VSHSHRGALSAIGAALALLAPAVAAARGEAPVAYIDPGAGSFLLQALVAMLAGALVAIKVYWNKLKGWLGLPVDADDDAERGSSPPPDA